MFSGKKSIMNGSICALVAILIIVVCGAIGGTLANLGGLAWAKIGLWIAGFVLAIVAVCAKNKVCYIVGVALLLVGEAISAIASIIAIFDAFKANVILGFEVLFELIAAILVLVLLSINLASQYQKTNNYNKAFKGLGIAAVVTQVCAAVFCIIFYSMYYGSLIDITVEEIVACILGAVAGALMYIVIAFGHVYVGANPNKLTE